MLGADLSIYGVMAADKYEEAYQSLTPDRVAEAANLLLEVGWSMSVRCYTLQYEVFGHKSWTVIYDEHKKLIGMSGLFVQDDDNAYVGSVIVRHSHRRQGMARALVSRIIRQYGTRNLILDSIAMYESLYGKLGFVTFDQTMKISFDIPEVRHELELPANVHKVTDAFLDDVLTYDETVHPHGRRNILEVMLTDDTNFCICSTTGGVVSGFLIGQSGLTMVSLYADNPETAELLMRGLVTSYPFSSRGGFHTKLPSCNATSMLAILKRLDFKTGDPIMHAYKMATRGPPQGVAWERVYGYLNLQCVIL